MFSQKKNSMIGNFMLLGAALIWGLAFTAQRQASGSIDAISFNGMRFLLAFATLLPVWIIFELYNKKKGVKTIGWNKYTVLGGMLCGFILFLGNNLQQLGVETTTAGKASFITALYIVLVPVFGLLMRHKTPRTGWFAVVIAIAGFWTMSVTDEFRITDGDLLVLLCAFIFSFHILFIDFFCEEADPIKLTLVQFLSAAAISVPAMAINEFPAAASINESIFPILYVGILSAGVGFTLQTLGQKRTEPALATLIMSLESVFGLLGGVIILHESSSVKELIGCLLVFIAVFLAIQTPHKTFLEIAPYDKKRLQTKIA